MLENVITDIRNEFSKGNRLNITYDIAKKEKTMAQMGFFFSALIDQITNYFRECGFNVDEDDVRYKLYEDVAEIVPEMVVDNILFKGKPRIKHLSDMDRATMAKFIDGIFTILDQDPMYAGIKMHPSIFYNFLYHLDPEDIKFAQTQKLAERDENYLNYIRTLPCLVCGIQHRSEAHHIRDTRTAGMAIKSPDFYAVPLCHNCHMSVAHGTGFKEALKWIPLDLLDFCKVNYIRWKKRIKI